MFHSSFYLAFISSFPLLFPLTMGFEVGCFSSICFPVNLALFPANWSNPSMGSGSFKEAPHVEIISCSYGSQSLNLLASQKLGRILDIHLKFCVSPFRGALRVDSVCVCVCMCGNGSIFSQWLMKLTV